MQFLWLLKVARKSQNVLVKRVKDKKYSKTFPKLAHQVNFEMAVFEIIPVNWPLIFYFSKLKFKKNSICTFFNVRKNHWLQLREIYKPNH